MLLHYFIAGGIFMWGILLASICGVAVILEKLWIFSTKEREFTKEYRKQLFKALKTESREKNSFFTQIMELLYELISEFTLPFMLMYTLLTPPVIIWRNKKIRVKDGKIHYEL